MGNLSKNLSREEFACKCGCGFDTVDHTLVKVIQHTCDYFAGVLSSDRVVCSINSGNRCESHNKTEGGSEKSQHITGKAADFRIKYISADRVADYLEGEYPGKFGIGRYSGRTHVDVRSSKARWDVRTPKADS